MKTKYFFVLGTGLNQIRRCLKSLIIKNIIEEINRSDYVMIHKWQINLYLVVDLLV